MDRGGREKGQSHGKRVIKEEDKDSQILGLLEERGCDEEGELREREREREGMMLLCQCVPLGNRLLVKMSWQSNLAGNTHKLTPSHCSSCGTDLE